MKNHTYVISYQPHDKVTVLAAIRKEKVNIHNKGNPVVNWFDASQEQLTRIEKSLEGVQDCDIDHSYLCRDCPGLAQR